MIKVRNIINIVFDLGCMPTWSLHGPDGYLRQIIEKLEDIEQMSIEGELRGMFITYSSLTVSLAVATLSIAVTQGMKELVIVVYVLLALSVIFSICTGLSSRIARTRWFKRRKRKNAC